MGKYHLVPRKYKPNNS